MPKKRWSKKYNDLRGRWIDNRKIVVKIVQDAQCGVDWTKRLKPFLADGAETDTPNNHSYKYSPDLRNICFDKYDLSSCNFSFAGMSDITAYRSFSTRINCSGSILARSRWGNSRHRNGNFANCNAPRAYFAHSDFEGSDFSKANLRYASFRKSNLSNVSFVNADLRFAYLAETCCDGADLAGPKFMEPVYGT